MSARDLFILDRWRWVKFIVLVWLFAVLFSSVCYASWDRKIDVHAEGGPLEVAQMLCWFAAAVVALGGVGHAGSWRDRASAVWLAGVALLAAAREADVHDRLRSGSSWLPPVHFRIDWLLDPAQAFGAKVFWLAAFAIAGACLVLPLLFMRAPTARFLRTGDAPTWLLILAFTFLGWGYLADDVLGRGRLGLHYEVTQGIEELFELCGALTFLAALLCEFVRPLSVRAAIEPPRIARRETTPRTAAVGVAPPAQPRA